MDEQIQHNSIHRINVVGTSGCGKSTFSRKLAEILHAPYLEIDKIFWDSNWSSLTDNELFDKLQHELSAEKWVLDGNYHRTVSVKWKNVQMVIWLDYSFLRVFARALKRATWRIITGKEIWEGTGNRESLKMLFSKDSIVLWTLKTYHPNKKNYNEIFSDENFAHIKFIRLSNPREAEHFLNQIQKG